MPIELKLLFSLAGGGVLLCILMYVLNGVVRKKAKIAAYAYDEDDDLEEDENEGGWAIPETTQMQPVSAPAATAAETMVMPPVAKQAEAEQISKTQTVVMPPVAEQPQRQAPLFTPLTRNASAEKEGAIIGQIRVTVGNAQDIGARPEQQDAFAITPLEEDNIVLSHGVMAVVCDGMGGLQGGAQASNMAAVQFMRTYLETDGSAQEAMQAAIETANRRVFTLATKTEQRVGTTLVSAALTKQGLWFISAGDSHVYLHRNSKLYQLNRDHNYYAELLNKVTAGEMTLEQARQHPERAHLTSFLGMEQIALIDANDEPIALRPGDRIVLCSDGLFKTLPAARMQSILASNRHDAHTELIYAVKQTQKPRQDNVSVVVLYLDQM